MEFGSKLTINTFDPKMVDWLLENVFHNWQLHYTDNKFTILFQSQLDCQSFNVHWIELTKRR